MVLGVTGQFFFTNLCSFSVGSLLLGSRFRRLAFFSEVGFRSVFRLGSLCLGGGLEKDQDFSWVSQVW